MLAAFQRQSGKSYGTTPGGNLSVQGAVRQGYTVPPAGEAPEVEPPKFSRYSGGPMGHRTSKLAYRMYTGNQQRIQDVQDQADQDVKDAEAQLSAAQADYHQTLGNPSKYSVSQRRAAVQNLSQARALHRAAQAKAGTAAEDYMGSTGFKARSALTGALSGIGTEGGALGGIIDAVPGAGEIIMGAQAAYKGVMFAGHEMENQRAANAQFQSIYGGTNMAGMGQRFQRFEHRVSGFGTIGGQAADEEFNEISQTGLQGAARTMGMNLATKEFMQNGLDIKSTLGLITDAIKNGNSNLTGLQEAINGVSKAAQQGGVNVQSMVQALGGQINANTGLYGNNAGTAAASQQVIGAAAKSGQVLSNFAQQGGYNFTGSQQFQTYLSAQGFGTLNQLQGMALTNGAAYGAITVEAIAKAMEPGGYLDAAVKAIQTYANQTPGLKQHPENIKNLVNNSSAINDIKAIFYQTAGANAAYSLQQQLNQVLGSNFSEDQAVTQCIMAAFGRISPGAGFSATAPQTDASGKPTAQAQKTLGSIMKNSTTQRDAHNHTERVSDVSNTKDLASVQGVLDSIGVKESSDGQGGKTLEYNGAQSAFLNAYKTTGQTDDVVQKLLKGNKYTDTKFDVTGLDGTVYKDQTIQKMLDLVSKGKLKMSDIDSASVSQDENNKNIRGSILSDLAGGAAGGAGGSTTFQLTPAAAWMLQQAYGSATGGSAGPGNPAPGASPSANVPPGGPPPAGP